MPHPYLVFKIIWIIFLSQTRSNFIIMTAITSTTNFQNSIVILSQNLYSIRGETALFEQLGSPRPRFPSTKRTATFAYVLSHSLLSLLSRVFPINYICQVGARNSASVSPCTREPRAAANADLRKIGARFWETVGQQTERERERGKGTPLRWDHCKCGYVSGGRWCRTQENI